MKTKKSLQHTFSCRSAIPFLRLYPILFTAFLFPSLSSCAATFLVTPSFLCRDFSASPSIFLPRATFLHLLPFLCHDFSIPVSSSILCRARLFCISFHFSATISLFLFPLHFSAARDFLHLLPFLCHNFSIPVSSSFLCHARLFCISFRIYL